MEDPALNWTCGFSPDGPLECLDAATWHGFQLTADGLHIKCMMASCETHRAKMRAHYQHPMGTACGITNSRFVWPENFCYIDWGDEPALSVGEVCEPVVGRVLLAATTAPAPTSREADR